jgi:hypothetical protein
MSSSQLQTQCPLPPQREPQQLRTQCVLVLDMYHPGRGVGSKYAGSHGTAAYLWALGLIWMWFGIVVSSSCACTGRWFAGLYGANELHLDECY